MDRLNHLLNYTLKDSSQNELEAALEQDNIGSTFKIVDLVMEASSHKYTKEDYMAEYLRLRSNPKTKDYAKDLLKAITAEYSEQTADKMLKGVIKRKLNTYSRSTTF
tara:strand:- start:1287 stop:1607 length:321 start_codon:yes stop_codon:yes gene_type:complete